MVNLVVIDCLDRSFKALGMIKGVRNELVRKNLLTPSMGLLYDDIEDEMRKGIELLEEIGKVKLEEIRGL